MKLKRKKFPFIQQLDSSDCGLACLRIIAKYYGVDIGVRNSAFLDCDRTKQGLSFSELDRISKKLGFESLFIELEFDQIQENVLLPAVFFWNDNHFVVVYKVTHRYVWVSDPSVGRLKYTKDQFTAAWKKQKQRGIIQIVKPTRLFFENRNTEKSTIDLDFTKHQLRPYKKQLYMLSIVLLFSSLIEFFFPFFTQKIIDRAVVFKNYNFLYLIFGGQILLFVSRILNEFYRTWLFIHISSRINLNMVSDFLMKLMHLPISFFYSKTIGDLLERIEDHKRIEKFLTEDLLKSVFAIFSLLMFSIILLYFSEPIFYIFAIGNVLQLTWVFSFLERIKILDKIKFRLAGKEQSKNIELISGMQEIKLNNLEDLKRKEWEKIQLELFDLNSENIQLNHKYESYRFISFLTSLLITFKCALSVIDGSLSIGQMMSIVFITGLINVPVTQLINCILNYKLLMVSVSRLDEINSIAGEISSVGKNCGFSNGNIDLLDLSFSYNGLHNVLDNIDLTIFEGTTTAIVGLSGSGKTTLLKLLLKFYTPQMGAITLNGQDLNDIDDTQWRNRCGVIFQDSFIFSNSILFNITLSEEYDPEQLLLAVEYANIRSFIEELPMKYETIIGQEGIGISQGQRQRLLIARAIYKNPDYLFFDEATNSLDTENEKIIVNNMETYFKGKTIVVVAHRLSTVMNADQIIVLERSKIVERGSHIELINRKGKYFNLIKNQLELAC